jgi:hypothetical protein
MEKLRLRWSLEKPSIDGAPAHAARAARAKGVRVTIGACLPRRLPEAFECFLKEYQIDTRFLRRETDGLVPQTLKLQFLDGAHRLIVDSGRTHSVPLPAAEDHFDVLLIHPRGPVSRRILLTSFRERMAKAPRTNVGLIGRGDWDASDWELINNLDVRVYLN